MNAKIRKLLSALSAMCCILDSVHAASDSPALERQASMAIADRSLTLCERSFVRNVFSGTATDCGPLGDTDRVVRAGVIAWIASSPIGTPTIGRIGIVLRGAKVVGKLDISNLKMPFPLAIEHSFIEEEMNLNSAELRELSFTGSKTRGVVAEGLNVSGSAGFDHGFRSEGRIHIVHAEIGAFLSFDGAILCSRKLLQEELASGRCTVRGNDAASVIADQLRVMGSLHMRDGFFSNGEVRLLNVSIQQDLNGHGGEFINPKGVALEAGGATVGGRVQLNRDDRLQKNFVAEGGVSFLGTQIAKDVYLDNAQLTPGSYLNFQRATITGAFIWASCAHAPVKGVVLDLRDASVTAVQDNSECWPEQGKLYLDGLRYRAFCAGSQRPDDASQVDPRSAGGICRLLPATRARAQRWR